MHDISSCDFHLNESDAKTQPDNDIGLRRIVPQCRPLSLEDADRILQNVLHACGYNETHLRLEKRTPGGTENVGWHIDADYLQNENEQEAGKSAVKQNGLSLLDHIVLDMNKMFLSDLKFCNNSCRREIAQLLTDCYPAESASLFEWNDAIYYLTGESGEKTEDQAREKLIRLLRAGNENQT